MCWFAGRTCQRKKTKPSTFPSKHGPMQGGTTKTGALVTGAYSGSRFRFTPELKCPFSLSTLLHAIDPAKGLDHVIVRDDVAFVVIDLRPTAVPVVPAY